MKTFLTCFALFVWGSLSAQSFSIQGQILDDQSGTPLEGAHVSLMHPWGEIYKTVLSSSDGRFALDGLSKGGYRLHISYIGFEDFEREVTLSGENADLGVIRLKEGVQLSEVEIKGKIPMAEQRGDTTQYNASAFKTLPDASAEELVEKMPGMVIENGKVQAQGEDVKEVLVDGRPFFGNDPTAALRNLPAEVIDKIQVFDQKSDQANFSGFDDGETSKTLNIITRPNMRNGQFGKVYAGYGWDNKYQGGGNASIFDGDRRISFIGQLNNVNQQNFATEDLLGVVGSGSNRGGRGSFRGRGGGGRGGRGGRGGGGSVNDFLVPQQGGISTTQAFGINYSDQWGSKTDISGSYFFNRTENDAEDISSTQFIDREVVRQIYDETEQRHSTNFNHRLNFRLNIKLDSANSIIMRPRLSFQDNSGFSQTLANTFLGADLLNQSDNVFNSDLNGVDFSNNLTFRHAFPVRGRTLSLRLRQGYNNKKGDSQLRALSLFFDGLPNPDTLDQFSNLDLKGWSLGANLTYTEPLGERDRLMLTYEISRQNDESEKRTYDFVEESMAYDALNEALSNVFENKYDAQSLGAGYNWSKGRDLFFMARGKMQWSRLLSDQTFPLPDEINRTYWNFLPMVMFRRNFSRQKNFMLMYRGSTRSPSVEQLQNVVDNSNPVQLTTGNPALDQSVEHRVFARFSNTNTEKSRVFFVFISSSFSNNYIGNAIWFSETDHPVFDQIDLEPGARLTRPENLSGYWNHRLFTTWGLPVSTIKTNLNFDLTLSYSKTPGLIDEALNYSKNATAGAGLTLSSNISEKVDFTVSTRSNFNRVVNTLQASSNSKYLSQTTRLKFNWILPGGLVFRNTAEHQFYTGLTDSFNDDYFLWTVGLGKKMFKNQRGELTLSVFDVLKQNQSISRNVTETYIEDLRSKVLQRYAMLTFTYNFRNFSTGKAPAAPPRDERRDPPWMRD